MSDEWEANTFRRYQYCLHVKERKKVNYRPFVEPENAIEEFAEDTSYLFCIDSRCLQKIIPTNELGNLTRQKKA